MPNQLSGPEWLLVRDALELLNMAWEDEEVLALGLARILKHLINAGTICIGRTDVRSALHKIILLDGAEESCREPQTVLERKIAFVIRALTSSEPPKRASPRSGNCYSDLAKPLVLGPALGAIVPIWSCSALVGIVATAARREHFFSSQREMVNVLIPHIGEAFRRIWAGKR